MNASTEISGQASGVDGYAETQDFVTFVIANQLFGISVLQVQDVLAAHRITRIPLAPPEIAGSLNLRGRVVTVIDVRRRLGLNRREAGSSVMSIVVEHGQDLYSLMVDSVGEVLALATSDFDSNPPTLDPQFREYSAGIYRLDSKLLVVLDVDRLLDYGRSAVA
ncbi:MAG: chemotaxis protein CheW [Rhodospirillales bacterium]|nr:chemotaxis protein CheW [Rhodospirillales bacterium]MDH3918582.1 chemotaxis protein CheW [Rhodospirillales bacterium]MDH3969846.1 chemotaxis protein CheW [Rhodospirillales bacterium]